MFQIHHALLKRQRVCDLKLSTVFFEDNKELPWIFVVPRVENEGNMWALSMEQRLQLMREITLCEKAMLDSFPCDNTNIEMLGNLAAQLHVHIICRRKNDKFWPKAVWGFPEEHYTPEDKAKMIATLSNAIDKLKNDPEYGQA